MMKIKVLFFAQLRKALGTAEKVVEVKEGTTAGELSESLVGPLGFGGSERLPLLFAVNENFTQADERLSENDVLAIMTPVAGG